MGFEKIYDRWHKNPIQFITTIKNLEKGGALLILGEPTGEGDVSAVKYGKIDAYDQVREDGTQITHIDRYVFDGKSIPSDVLESMSLLVNSSNPTKKQLKTIMGELPENGAESQLNCSSEQVWKCYLVDGKDLA